MTTTFSIYTVKQYNTMKSSRFDDNLIKFEDIDDIVEELTTVNNSYHFRIHTNTTYIFFGDLDHYNKSIETFINLLKIFIATYYNLHFEDNDFKYTKNNSKEGSYHYSIPKWNLTTEKLKEIHIEFIKEYKTDLTNDIDGRVSICVDTSIYSEHWFRCPNQYKGNNNDVSKHIIVNGNMKDFIIDYIPEFNININNIIKINKINNDIIVHSTSNTLNSSIIPIKTRTRKTKANINNGNANALQIVIPSTNTSIIESTNIIHPELLSESIFRSNLYKQFFENCYKQTRFDDYNTWIAIGMAIKKIFPNDEDGLELFNYFSSKYFNAILFSFLSELFI